MWRRQEEVKEDCKMQNTECPAWVTAMDAPGAWADRLSDLADGAGVVSATCVLLTVVLWLGQHEDLVLTL